MRDSAVKRRSALHRVLYRSTGGALGRRLVSNDVLLLTTKGRSTGRPHTVPLLYFRHGSSLVLVASYGGRDRHPEWYLNLDADPEVGVQIGPRYQPMRARTATSADRDALWSRVVAGYPGYARYQERTRREIPIVILDPARPS